MKNEKIHYFLEIPLTNEKRNKIIKIKKRILAISIEIISTPVNPNKPATIAKIRNMNTSYNPIVNFPFKKQ